MSVCFGSDIDQTRPTPRYPVAGGWCGVYVQLQTSQRGKTISGPGAICMRPMRQVLFLTLP
jgi:hypothetical protein